MIIRTISLLSALILAAQAISPVLAEDQKGVTAPDGEYVAIALRRSSSVRGTPDPGVGSEWLAQRVSFSDRLVWLDGVTCNRWSVMGNDFPVIKPSDPNLSDLTIAPLDSRTSAGDRRVGKSAILICQDGGKKIIGNILIVDDRVLVASDPPWTVNVILEKPLRKDQVRKLQAQLKDMKFYSGEITGTIDVATRAAVSFYAEYRGAEYRFANAAITENLLDGLNVLDGE